MNSMPASQRSFLDLGPSVWVAVIVGALLRAIVYLSDRSIGLDESLVSLNIIRRSPFELLERLDWNSGAPLGFLEAEKAIVGLLGASETTLRLVPFLASLASLVLLGAVARRTLTPPGPALAVGLLAVLPLVVDYSGIVKQYSSDVAVVAAVLLLALQAVELPLTAKKAGLLGASFAVAPLLSHPAVFVALGAVLVLLVSHALEPRKRQTRYVLGVAASSLVVVAVGALLYLVALREIARGLAGGGIRTVDDARDFLGAVRAVLGVGASTTDAWDWLGVIATVTIAVLYLVGLRTMAMRRWEHAAIVGLPVLIAVIAIALSLYPHELRTLVFLTPLCAVPIASGIATAVRSRSLAPRACGGLAALVVFAAAVHGVADLLGRVRHDDDRVRAAMTYLSRHERAGDRVYLWQTTQYPFTFELECSCFEPPAMRSGLWPVRPVAGSERQWSPALTSDDPDFVIGANREPRVESFEEEIDHMRGSPRVWILLGPIESANRIALVRYLDSVGRRIESFDPTDDYEGVDVLLYDLRRSDAQ